MIIVLYHFQYKLWGGALYALSVIKIAHEKGNILIWKMIDFLLEKDKEEEEKTKLIPSLQVKKCIWSLLL